MRDCALYAHSVREAVREGLVRSVLFLSACFVGLTGILGGADTAAAQSWSDISPMPSPRYGMAAVALDGDIYVIGGRDRLGEPLSSALRYDSESDTWHSDVAHLPTPRVESAAVVLDGRIFIIGGAGGDEAPVADVFAYDPSLNEWSEVDQLEHSRYGHGAIVIDGRIWAVGGRDQDGQLVKEIEIYRPDAEAWAVLSEWKLKNPRVSFALVAVADAVYAMFGYGSGGPIPDAERFDRLTDADVFVLSFLLRGRLATVSVDNTAYLLGGRAEPDHVISEVLMFTPSADDFFERWRLGPSMLTARESFAAVTVGGDIYAIGGRTQDGSRDGVPLGSVERLSVSTAAEDEAITGAETFRLEQNHPNPFTNSTTLPFVLSGSSAEQVTVEVYDLQGRLVDTIIDRRMPPGRHQVRWDGEAVRTLSSGTYVYVLKYGQNRQVRTLTTFR